MYLHAVFKKPILNIKQVKNKRLKKDIPANVIHKKADLVILMFLFVCFGFFSIFLLLFICACKAWFISPRCLVILMLYEVDVRIRNTSRDKEKYLTVISK
jgi:hypothetical protein